MSNLKATRAKEELANKHKKGDRKGLYEFVPEATQHRSQTLPNQGILERLEDTHIVSVRGYTCTNGFVHNIKVVKYDDSSVWVVCPMFGWFEEAGSDGILKLGCKERKKRCTWFVG
jgi:hypothetical protein